MYIYDFYFFYVSLWMMCTKCIYMFLFMIFFMYEQDANPICD
jgi:hypothetical protein